MEIVWNPKFLLKASNDKIRDEIETNEKFNLFLQLQGPIHS